MNLRRHGSKEWVTEIDQRRRMHLRLNGFRQTYEDLKLNGFGQAYGAFKFYHVDRSRQHGCWQLIAKHAATNSTSSGATATVKCYNKHKTIFSKHKTILKGYNWEKSTLLSPCLLWNYRHRFCCFDPLDKHSVYFGTIRCPKSYYQCKPAYFFRKVKENKRRRRRMKKLKYREFYPPLSECVPPIRFPKYEASLPTPEFPPTRESPKPLFQAPFRGTVPPIR